MEITDSHSNFGRARNLPGLLGNICIDIQKIRNIFSCGSFAIYLPAAPVIGKSLLFKK
jgi:hypothetical protein